MADISQIQNGESMTLRDQLALTIKLSLPAILAQLSSILMQYIDAAMVGRLGANDSAAIGLVSTSLWLFWGICGAMTNGFTVQVAHRIGAKDEEGARAVLRQGVTSALIFSSIVSIIALLISESLPVWLGGGSDICGKSTSYFAIYVMALPMLTMNFLAGGMLRSVGNIKIVGILNVLMAILDVIFNFFLIFSSRTECIFGIDIEIPGAGLGLRGAALGTVLAEIITASLMCYVLFSRQKEIRLKGHSGSWKPNRNILSRAIKISTPLTIEHAVLCGAQVMVTIIVAPLGVVAIAANAFGITIESLCYMPGYGIGEAAMTLTGQSYGAKRYDLAKRFGYITVAMGMFVMTIMGLIMYLTADITFALMTDVATIRQIGAEVLRIEAYAEPMFASAIVAYGVMVGVGDTLIPAMMNFGSIWLVRIPLAAIFAPIMGLKGVWIAMCIELCVRGAVFLYRLVSGKWIKPSKELSQTIK